jgi:hypothetical protein
MRLLTRKVPNENQDFVEEIQNEELILDLD